MSFRMDVWSICLSFALLIPAVRTKLNDACSNGCSCPNKDTALCNGTHWKEIPQTLARSLRDLTLTHCPISEIREGSFYRYPQLERVILDWNQITTIHPHAFRGLQRLKTLSMQHNRKLTALTRFSLSQISGLQQSAKIYLGHNNISRIDGYAFFNNENIRKLDLRKNPLKTVHAHAFSGLHQVDFIHLPMGIEKIEKDAFHNMSRIHFIELRNWKAHLSGGIQARTFNGLRRVSTLRISHSNLGVVQSNAFAGVETIEHIQIIDSNIDRLKKRCFSGMRHVGKLLLERNKIDRIERRLFEYIKAEKFQFNENQLNCVCKNMWLLKEEYEIPEQFLLENYCYKPISQENRPIEHIDEEYAKKCLNKVTEEDYSDENNGAFDMVRTGTITYIIIPLLLVIFRS